MKNYVGVKLVQAEPCIQDGREGYSVVYPDGYESWSPKDVFEAAYLCLGDDPTKISRETVIEFIGDNVWSETLEGGKTTLVKAKTLSGFEQIEASSCVDPSNYDEEIGVNCCMKRIEDTIWKCLGFTLQWARDGLKGAASKGKQSSSEVACAQPLIRCPVDPSFIACICHEVNRAYCEAIGDHSQLPWYEAPVWQQKSALSGVQLHLEHPEAGPEASHESWMAQKVAGGWTYGLVKDPEKKTHPCLVPFAELPTEQQAKDYIFRAIVRAIAES